MMKLNLIRIGAVFTLLLVSLSTVFAESKPLKVFMLVGQSNMEGHAQTRTFPAIAKDPKTADMYTEMVDAEGKPVVCDNVWIAYSYGDFGGNPVGTKAGKLTAGWGSQHHIGTGKIGPEFTFGIYMQKLLDEPILLIKTAWGGKSLHTDFRSPSAGPQVYDAPINEEKKAAKEKATGRYYKLMIEYVKGVLADPKNVYPAYDPSAGYELAGLVWFQGFNDLVGPYPRVDPKLGKKSPKDYSEYSRLLSCFIRDVRQDLSVPNLPFVTGVLGCGGETENENTMAFHNAMAAPAETDELKSHVANVFTAKYWPTELDAILAKTKAIKADGKKKSKAIDALEMDRKDKAKAKATLVEEIRAGYEKVLTEDELFLFDNGISNQGFHYYGSAKFFGEIGKAFAEALVDIKKK